LHYEVHELINSVRNREELPQKGKDSIIVPIYRKGDETDYSNYIEISLLPTTYSFIQYFFSMLTPYVGEIIGNHQCGFRRNRSNTDHIFCIRRIMKKKGV